ncbi:ATP-binding cassette domain-containing protein [Arcanobacterium phocae]|uniref:ATP-binding cassette domain-containing protein n=1 Tax=Arcanobacterium phocae TaxID=131112 RepID=UPI001C0EDE69|nr:ATP-binding cassette domain-containing protein [Arcanobacterium phocae]
MIFIDNLVFSYRNKSLFSKLSIEIHPGRTVLVGPNGAGKTTLMALLSGKLQIAHGNISWPSDSFFTSWMPQRIKPIRSFTVREQLSYIGWLEKVASDQLSQQIQEVLTSVNLLRQADTRSTSLSGGQLRRLGLAQALIGNPDLLILDEPTAGLDVTEYERLRDLLFSDRRLAEYMLVSTHDIRELAASFDWVILLQSGEVKFSGSVPEFLGLTPHLDPVESYYVATGTDWRQTQ